ncbi:DUF2164 domain-containing protein [Ferrimonas sediminicola]|uniref:DUF2164 domain-containing protein n=1 Tax=Ferrimonas sediminicola TaxID=2569538 RepID=A0A4U1BDD4_9GAMM|nr:DUF2164 domain-containing protein [Ferrimonas sediminicola]
MSKAQREALVEALQSYSEQEMEQELGQFEAEFLLDFMLPRLGTLCYNKGLEDARIAILARMELATEVVYEMEQPCDL